jgi:hypothetical protein
LRTCDADECRYDLYTLGTDGSGLFDVMPDAIEERNPSWSPDGTRIAFDSSRSGNQDIYSIAPDGTALRRLTDAGAAESDPDWSPFGDRIVFLEGTRIWTMSADGSSYQQLLSPPNDFETEADPAWSPDGSKIAYRRPGTISPQCVGIHWTIWVMGSGGTPRQQVSHPPPDGQDCRTDYAPDWQPIPGTYARPKGATPLRVPLVPAFRQCTVANTTHGAPLAFGSCAPPAQESSSLTVGTSEANGLPNVSVGSVLLKAKPGDPATPANEADVLLNFSLTDVRRSDTLAPYQGEVLVVLDVRITDRLNPSNEAATVTDQELSFYAVCSADQGGRCQLGPVSLNSIIPSVVRENKRSIWELDRIRVFDGGPDDNINTPGDNQLFATQGLFAP